MIEKFLKKILKILISTEYSKKISFLIFVSAKLKRESEEFERVKKVRKFGLTLPAVQSPARKIV